MEYMCIIAVKPLYTLLFRDMKHTWYSHINMLFSALPWLKYNAGTCGALPWLKYNAKKFLEKSLFNYGVDIIKWYFFRSTYQIGKVERFI